MDGSNKPYNTIFGVTWGLLASSLLFALPVVLYKVKDHVPVEHDLKFSDETIADVVVGSGPADSRRASRVEEGMSSHVSA